MKAIELIELIEDVCIFGGSVPNKKIKEVRRFLNKLKAQQLKLCEVSAEFKDKHTLEFEEFVKTKTKEQKIASIYWYNDIGFLSLEDLYKHWQTIKVKP